jgi:ectoine hydroxylase-related dioxygenase (phytanoyl-CoA dioxygenase family)
VLAQPPQSGSVGYHRDSDYISAQFTHTRENALTVWMPLDDANEQNGTIEYAVGSHRWDVPSDRVFHSAGESYREPVLRAARSARKSPNINFEAVSAQAGDIVIHHQDTWHGSGPNRSSDQHRRTLVGHYLRGDVEFRLASPFAANSSSAEASPAEGRAFYIYGRYRHPDSSKLEDRFFPLVYGSNGERSSWIDAFTKSVV